MGAISQFLTMGGHAGYIWPAYGVAVVVLGVLAIASLRGLRARERELAVLEAARPRSRRRRPDGDGGADGDDP
jgi:heme exporter protein D